MNLAMDTVRTLKLGDTELARIGLGTNRLARTPAHVALIRDAVAAGVGMVDTAHSYVGGESELTIGDALAPGFEHVVVATKGGAGGAGRGHPEALRAEIDTSLRRLRTARIALYYLHRVDPETPIEESVETLRTHGAIERIGLSEVSVEEIERARAVAPIAAVQNDYSLAERKHEAVVDYCEREGIVFVPFFPLRGADRPAVEEIAASHGATPTQIALAWLLRRSPAMLPIPGTLSLEHLRENLAALDLELTDAEFEALAS
jgi:aryl-alcohol dehydrogenase-like predicted oxidoreductase